MKRYRILNLFVGLTLLLALIPVQSTASASVNPADIDPNEQFIPGQLIVSFAEGQKVTEIAAHAFALANEVNGMVLRQNGTTVLMKVGMDADVTSMAEQVSGMEGVVYAQPNYVYRLPEKAPVIGENPVTGGYAIQTAGKPIIVPWNDMASMISTVSSLNKKKKVVYTTTSIFPNEMASGNAWGWDKIQADLIWNNTTVSPLVCIVDTGVDKNHPDLSGRVVWGYDFVNNDAVPADDNGHGTFLAGIIASNINNGTGTAAGVSKGNVLAVKALNSQGVGTSYSIAAAIRYCHANASVGVINLSFTSSLADSLVYNAINYAITPWSYITYVKQKVGRKTITVPVTNWVQGVVVVAAAGNDSSSKPAFPAAWAKQNYKINGVYEDTASSSDNAIYPNMLSVGGGRSPSDTELVWVDNDRNGTAVSKELFSPDSCASGIYYDTGAVGTNYGRWVNIVAPGDNILSTTPMSNPFYMNYYQGVTSYYDTLSGTSLAAAYVSGAAARAWNFNSSKGDSVKAKLISSGNPLYNATDPEKNYIAVVTKDLDPTIGFKNSSGTAHEYGVPYASSGNSDDAPDRIQAPFCWPGVAGDFTAVEDMSTAVYLNVAAAIDRGAIYAEVKDAGTALPLDLATIATSSGVSINTVAGNARALLINVPFDGSSISLSVNRSGYTNGAQTFNSMTLPNSDRGTIKTDPYNIVSLPQMGGIQFVLDWMIPDSPGYPDLDMSIWLPFATATNGFVGPTSKSSSDAYSFLTTKYLGIGTVLDPSTFGGTFSPFAQHFLDGGVDEGVDQESFTMSPTEFAGVSYGTAITTSTTVIVKRKPKIVITPRSPYYQLKYPGQYTVTITDYSQDTDKNYLASSADEFVYPILRVWSNGVLVSSNKAADDSSCAAEIDWWKLTTGTGETWSTITNDGCKVGSDVAPY